MNTTERKVIESFRRLLARKLSVDQIVLFGSRARGDAAPDSDMDILVVINKPIEDTEEYVSDCAWEAGPERFSLLARAIEMEGIPV
jgi:predicted nucleotidyltransferase